MATLKRTHAKVPIRLLRVIRAQCKTPHDVRKLLGVSYVPAKTLLTGAPNQCVFRACTVQQIRAILQVQLRYRKSSVIKTLFENTKLRKQTLTAMEGIKQVMAVGDLLADHVVAADRISMYLSSPEISALAHAVKDMRGFLYRLRHNHPRAYEMLFESKAEEETDAETH